MPSIRDISVHVTDSQGIQLKEWGIQHLRTQKRQAKVSSYITSKSNTAFKIVVEAKIPYSDYCSDRTEVASEEARENFSSHYNVQDFEPSSDRKHRSSLTHSRSVAPAPPPFDLLATLYVDGREKAERKVIVYLDPEYEDFCPGFTGDTARQVIRSRLVRGNDGSIHEHAWIFKDIGIETILDQMALTTGSEYAEKDEDAVIDALSRTGICHEDDIKREESNRAGQIEVTIHRIFLRRKKIDRDFNPKHQEGENDDIDMGGLKPEVTHTTGLAPVRTVSAKNVPVVTYDYYDEDEEPFAIFKFFYRSQETLEKFNFPGFQKPKNKPTWKRNDLNNSINSFTPLGILRGQAITYKSKRFEGKAFEDQVREGNFMNHLTPQYSYNDQNRRVTLTKAESSPSEDHEFTEDGLRTSRSSGIKAELCDTTNDAGTRPTSKSALAGDGLSSSSISSTQHRKSFLKLNGSKRMGTFSADTEPTAPRPSRLDPSDSCYASVDTVSPRSPYLASSETNGSLSPVLPANEKATNPLQERNRLAVKVSNNTLRDDTSSDADDEQEPASDFESLGDRVLGDDDGLSLDKDDEGLHHQLRKQLKLKRRKRTRDANGKEEDGESKETPPCSSDESPSVSNDAASGLAVGLKENEGTKQVHKKPGKRVKVASQHL